MIKEYYEFPKVRESEKIFLRGRAIVMLGINHNTEYRKIYEDGKNLGYSNSKAQAAARKVLRNKYYKEYREIYCKLVHEAYEEANNQRIP